jgi:hypothetical protein
MECKVLLRTTAEYALLETGTAGVSGLSVWWSQIS